MLIRSLELRNIKSYGNQSFVIPFEPGVNLILGENGSGKTTLLEAIGFVLFGSLDYKRDQFVREGATVGEIILTVISPLDERAYQLVRTVGRSSTLKVFDVETGMLLCTKTKDSEDWLAEQFGIERGDYTRLLFSEAVGVPQGKVTGIFMENKGARQQVFDPLLRVEEYKDAFEKLRTAASFLNKQRNEVSVKVAGLEGELRRRPEVVQELENLERDLQTSQDQINQATQELDRLNGELEGLNAAQEHYRQITQELDRSQQRLETLKGQVKVAEEALQEAELAQQIIEEAEDGYLDFLEASRQGTELEARREQRDQLVRDHLSIETDLGRISSRLEELAKQVQQVVQAEARLSELEPLVDQQSRLEAQRDSARTQTLEREQALANAEQAQSRATGYRAALEETLQKLKVRKQVEARLTEIVAERKDALEHSRTINEEIKTRRERRKGVETTLRLAENDKQTYQNALARWNEEQAGIASDRQRLGQVELELQKREQLQEELEQNRLSANAALTSKTSAESKNERYTQEIEKLGQRLGVLRTSESAECPVCRRSLDEHQVIDLEEEFESERQKLLAKQAIALETAQTAVKEIERLHKEQKQIEKKLNPLATSTQLEQLRLEISEREAQAKSWKEQADRLEDAPQRYQAGKDQLQGLDQEIEELEHQQAVSQTQIGRLDDEIESQNRQISQLPLPGRAAEINAEIQQAEGEAQSERSHARSLDDAPQRFQEAEDGLRLLGDPRREQVGCQAIADRRSKLEADQIEGLRQQSELETQRQEKSTELQAFTTLDEDLRQVGIALRTNKTAYERYLANQTAAATMNERRKRLEERTADKTRHEEAYVLLVQKYTQAQAAYDPQTHARVRDEVERLKLSIAGLDAQQGEWQKRSEQLDQELKVLNEIQESLEAACAEATRLERLAEVFEFVRQGLNKAGPLVVQRRVRRISSQADRIFQEILADPTLTLEWDAGYEIKVRCRGEERSYKQLSGGEQMSAALAVRLALLIQMSQIRLLFLDEPTANLDDTRREKLAERITRLESLKQIFVITHDDAFRPETQHVLQVRKENDVSRIEVNHYAIS